VRCRSGRDRTRKRRVQAAFPYSTFYNSPGTLFVVQSGTELPRITARYEDRDTIPARGRALQERPAARAAGIITANTDVNVITGRISVNAYTVTNVSVCSINTAKQCASNADCLVGEGLCNSCSLLPSKPCVTNAQCLAGQGVCTSTAGRGDPDGFADTTRRSTSRCSSPTRPACRRRRSDGDPRNQQPNIECITRSAITVGALANGALSNTATYLPFQFKWRRRSIAPRRPRSSGHLHPHHAVGTSSTPLSRAVDIYARPRPSRGGQRGHFGLHRGLRGRIRGSSRSTRSTPTRTRSPSRTATVVQYNDPFGLNSYSSDNTDCFLGSPPTVDRVNDWHVHTSTMGNIGSRVHREGSTLHLGMHKNANSPDQTRRA